jgi:hypothetical protein
MTKQICLAASLAIAAIAASAFQQPVSSDQTVEARIRELTEKVARLESRLRMVEWRNERANQPALAANRKRFEERTALDARTHTPAEMDEIEALYQVGHKEDGQPRGEAIARGIESHKRFIARYPKTNRAGCAMLDIAHMADYPESEEYLKRAIAEYGDSFYGNGVSIGAYGRYLLAYQYKRRHRDEEAAALIDEIRNNYADAVTPDGGPLEAYLDTISPAK